MATDGAAPERHEARRDRPGPGTRERSRAARDRHRRAGRRGRGRAGRRDQRGRRATAWRCPPRRTPRSRRSTPARSGAPTSGCGTRGRCTTSRCTPASCTTPSTPTTTPRSQVPGILRSIYAYHTRSRGWSDIGYNFLVDRFGRIWEGRYGGVDRPVVGAHTLGYNDNAFAMSAIGNFETAPAVPGDAPGVRRAVRVEAVAARGQRRLDEAVGDQAQLQGDQRAPRRRLHGVPGQVPLRQDPADPRAGRASCRRAGRAGSSSPTSRAPTTPTSSCGASSDGMAFVLPIRPSGSSYKIGKPIRTGFNMKKHRGLLQRRRLGPRREERPDLPQLHERRAVPEARARHRQVRAGEAGRLRLRRGPAAGRGRRHDRRRLARPDGPAARRRDADLPRQGRRRVQAPATSRTARSTPAGRSRSGCWNADGAPDSLIRKGASS